MSKSLIRVVVICSTVLFCSRAFPDNMIITTGNVKSSHIPKRVVSINLCTDELAIQLAKPGQLQAVTFLVKDASSSVHWQAAKSFKSHNNSLEQIVSYQPDLILASQYTPVALLSRLQQLGFRVYVLPIAQSLKQVNANIMAVGRRLGNRERAKQLVIQRQKQINLIKMLLSTENKLKVIVYLPGGLSHSGKGLTSQLIKMAGLQNMASAKGFAGWHSVSIEQLLYWNPDILIVIQSYTQFRSMATELLNHPAIHYFRQQKRVVTIPVQWLSCGSPSSAKILRALSNSRQQYRRGHP
ncbi:hypothetical protein MNBD_GAMMA12-1841 [hydrothermal vent metagenome]|uniref:Fe/B12 periplasmic-binding domain-containing protein n=1 Tax=hydrothermal vent metagenome TaxID=652676 RepID=A0A3B0Z654_9ZZZZ